MAIGDARLLFPRNYLSAADLRGKDKVLTISRVIARETLKTDRGSERKPALMFVETDKANAAGKDVPTKLVLNKTNMKSIAAALGTFIADEWVGKAITLFPTTCQGAGGQTVDCIRVRNTAPKKGAAEPEPEDREPGADEDIDPETGEVKGDEAAE